MQQSRRTVIGVFDEGAMADQAVTALENAGFSSAEIHRHGHQATGGFLSGLRNFFSGDTNQADDTDFSDLGVSGDEASYYEGESQAGRHIVSVSAPGREEEAMSILRANGAYNYGTRRGGTGAFGAADATGATSTMQTANTYDNTTVDPARTGTTYDNTVDTTRTDPAYDNTVNTTRTDPAYDNTVDTNRTGAAYDNTVGTTGAADVNTDEARRLQLREEQLNVNKERVQTGEVGLHKDVISEEKAIDVPVTHEEAYIERRPVTDATVNDTTPIGEGETIRVPLSEEQVNVNKNTVVTGEVEVGKRAVQENQRVSDTVRHEEARVDRDGDVRVNGGENDLTNRTDDRNL